MKRLHLTTALAALGAASAFAQSGFPQSDINTVPQWNGTSNITDWGPTVTATYGQTFKATAASGALNSFTFYTRVSIGAPALQYKAYVYEWDPGTRRIVGSALFTSAVSTMHSNAGQTPVTVDTGGIRLIAGKQYVFFVTLAGVTATPQTGGAYAFGGVPDAVYADGQFVFQNNNLDFSLLSAQAWRLLGAGQDLAMLMRMGPTLSYAMTVAGNNPGTPAAGALDVMLGNSSADPGDASPVATAFSSLPTVDALSNAVNQTLPLFTSGMNSITLNTMREVNRVIQARVDGQSGISAGDAFQGDRSAWVKPYGSYAQQDAREGVAGYTARSTGVVFGADRHLSGSDSVGIAAAFGQVRVNGSGGVNNNASIQNYTLIGYGRHTVSDGLDLTWQVDGGMAVNKGHRLIDFGGLNRTASATYNAYTAHAGGALSRSYSLSADTTFAPALRADYSHIRSRGYTEDGAGVLNLAVGSASAQEMVIGAEGRLAHKLSVQSTLTANLGLGYDALAKRNAVTAAYAGGGGAFLVEGIRPSPWILRGGIGLTFLKVKTAQIALRYDVEARRDFVNQTASVNVRVPF
ncbi:outer membrane autotransporter barrel domain-containing protein [Polaromonas sp. YR568]|uniref:autotransporter family protein n=1 Tax=Polaromonas sp. YR568 TaxID=1855301 RepID=UPI0008DEC44A|nr:autotransporter outer membrane beta-barrel domain-containing protein [Polaromonas sp. YR568]SFU47732.1 outer membrane autotransporter barrel domain-containing protein [Polaromonas sp. YR568]